VFFSLQCRQQQRADVGAVGHASMEPAAAHAILAAAQPRLQSLGQRLETVAAAAQRLLDDGEWVRRAPERLAAIEGARSRLVVVARRAAALRGEVDALVADYTLLLDVVARLVDAPPGTA